MCTVEEQYTQNDTPFFEKNFSRFTSHFSQKRCPLMRGDVHKSRRKAAFTLAEVLITLGIIGVVAAITIPTLIQDYREQATVAKVKKFYSILSQSYLQAAEENGDPTQWGLQEDCGKPLKDCNTTGNVNWFNIQFKPYVKIAKNCGTGTGCFKNKKITHLNGSLFLSGYSLEEAKHYYKFVLMDGTAVAIKNSSPDCSRRWGINALGHSCGHVLIDVDGRKGPNTFGKDIFAFNLTSDGYFPSGTPDELANGNRVFENIYMSDSGLTTFYIIKNGNMDYLHWEKNLGDIDD